MLSVLLHAKSTGYIPIFKPVCLNSNMYVFKLLIKHKTTKEKKKGEDFWKLLESQNILILHSLHFFCSQCFSDSYGNFKNPFVFPSNLEGKKKRKKENYSSSRLWHLTGTVVTVKIATVSLWFYFWSFWNRYGFINFRHQCKSTTNVLYNHTMLFHKHTG